MMSDWNDLLNPKDEDEQIRQAAQLLMYMFLGEVEKYQEINGVNKKTLAAKIKTSPSYVTQLFRGDTPLNFETIAKMQRALKIKFSISATPTVKTSPAADTKATKKKRAKPALYTAD